jgi:glyceraldehyde-3-phosphate dehydrogenase (arsenate-transferring)
MQVSHRRLLHDLTRAGLAPRAIRWPPTTTGSATAIGLIVPELRGRLNGLAARVPMLNASPTDCVFAVERGTSVDEVNGLLEAAAAGPLVDRTQVKILAWHDNGWGYANRLVELARAAAPVA